MIDIDDVYIIGEAGSCHEGDLTRAHKLIDVAVLAGCNAVKFQYWSSPQRMRERRHIDTNANLYESGSIHPEWIVTLKQHAQSTKINFVCTVYLPEDIPALAPHVDAFKISSFEASDAELRELIPLHFPLFISTGMMRLGDLPRTRGVLLHCVSAYPCPLPQANLEAIYGNCDGYSDHTRNPHTGGFAVSAGADFLEVHFRLDTTSSQCPDYIVSLTPAELGQYVSEARLAYLMRGDGRKRMMPSEEVNLPFRVIPW